MNLLLISWRDIKHSRSGGEEKYLFEILRRFSTSPENSVTYICCGSKNLPNEEQYGGIRFIRIGNMITFFFLVAYKYIQLSRREDFDVVVENITVFPTFTPIYVSEPILGVIHHIENQTFFDELPLPLAVVGWLIERSIPLAYSAIPFITVSESSRQEMEKLGLSVKTIVHNGVDNIEHVEIPPDDSEVDSILYLGRLIRYKRIEELIKAYSILEKSNKNLEFNIAGEGNYSEVLKRLAKQNRLLNKINFLGYVNEKEKLKLMREADVFVIASRKEGWGIPIIEANTQGTPVVAYNVAGLRDSVQDGETGLLCDSTPQSMATHVQYILNNDQYKKQLEKNAILWAKKFSWEKSAVDFENVVYDLL